MSSSGATLAVMALVLLVALATLPDSAHAQRGFFRNLFSSLRGSSSNNKEKKTNAESAESSAGADPYGVGPSPYQGPGPMGPYGPMGPGMMGPGGPMGFGPMGPMGQGGFGGMGPGGPMGSASSPAMSGSSPQGSRGNGAYPVEVPVYVPVEVPIFVRVRENTRYRGEKGGASPSRERDTYRDERDRDGERDGYRSESRYRDDKYRDDERRSESRLDEYEAESQTKARFDHSDANYGQDYAIRGDAASVRPAATGTNEASEYDVAKRAYSPYDNTATSYQPKKVKAY